MRLLRAWNTYWFTPAPLINLAVVRLSVVGFQLVYLFTEAFMRKLTIAAGYPEFIYDPLPVVRLLLFPLGWGARPELVFLLAVFWLAVGTGLLAFLGLFTRPSLFIFGAANLLMQAFLFSFGDYHHRQAIIFIALFILALSPAGAVLSLDAWLAGRRMKQSPTKSWLQQQSPDAGWPLLTLQWLFGLIYFSAAVSKIGFGGLDWLNGYTLQFYLIRDGLRWGSDLGLWLGQFRSLAILFSILAVLFEATFFLIVIFRKLAWLYLPFGIAMHTIIFLTQRAPFWQFILLYVVFIPWDKVIHALVGQRIKIPVGVEQVYVDR